MSRIYDNRLRLLQEAHETLITRANRIILPGNGIFERYEYPVLTNEHAPLEWRYDLNPETNPSTKVPMASIIFASGNIR